MRPSIIAVIGLASMFLFAVVVLVVADRVRQWRHRDRRSPELRDAEDAAYRKRLLSPLWNDVTAITGGIPSAALRALYDDPRVLGATHFVVRLEATEGDLSEEYIAGFQPADAVTLEDEWRVYLPRNAFPFARDVAGDFLFVELEASGKDSPVRHWFHDGGEVLIISPSVAAFHQACREAVLSTARRQPPDKAR